MSNEAASDAPPAPAPGVGATLVMFTDRRPYTVTRVSPTGKILWATEDIAKRTDSNGMDESQTYDYTTDKTASEERFYLTHRGWHGKRGRLAVGHRRYYHDFSF